MSHDSNRTRPRAMSNTEQSVAERLNNIAPDDEAKRDRFIEDELLISLLNRRNRIHRENSAGIAVTSELVFAYDTAIAERETVVGVLRRLDESKMPAGCGRFQRCEKKLLDTKNLRSSIRGRPPMPDNQGIENSYDSNPLLNPQRSPRPSGSSSLIASRGHYLRSRPLPRPVAGSQHLKA